MSQETTITAYVIKRDVDVDGVPLPHDLSSYWCGQRGGGWGWLSCAQKYQTRKLAEAALKRNRNSRTAGTAFRRGHPYVAEIVLTSYDDAEGE